MNEKTGCMHAAEVSDTEGLHDTARNSVAFLKQNYIWDGMEWFRALKEG